VQISAAVVRTIASSGPGDGMGFSTTAVDPTFSITNARIVSDMAVGPFADGWSADRGSGTRHHDVSK
jgi:hypothetical protein